MKWEVSNPWDDASEKLATEDITLEDYPHRTGYRYRYVPSNRFVDVILGGLLVLFIAAYVSWMIANPVTAILVIAGLAGFFYMLLRSKHRAAGR